MNKVILMGRLVRDPEVRYSKGVESTTVARYTLAVDRRQRANNEASADFISCIAFNRAADFAEKYLKKGTKIAITGRIQTDSYTNKDGVRVYTTDVIIEEQEFAESKNPGGSNGAAASNRPNTTFDDGFMNIPDGLDEDLPFN